ncbi:unnamed protein product [Camellia sinensis]
MLSLLLLLLLLDLRALPSLVPILGHVLDEGLRLGVDVGGQEWRSGGGRVVGEVDVGLPWGTVVAGEVFGEPGGLPSVVPLVAAALAGGGQWTAEVVVVVVVEEEGGGGGIEKGVSDYRGNSANWIHHFGKSFADCCLLLSAVSGLH